MLFNPHTMTTRSVIKGLLLALPVFVLIYTFFISKISNGGVGGGGYDLSELYYTFFALIYLLLLNIFFLIQGVQTNRYFLIVGVILFLIVLIVFLRMLW